MGVSHAQIKIRADYNANPNRCGFCGEGILARDGEPLAWAREKKFCSHSCAAKFHHKHGTYKKTKPGPPRRPRLCINCGKTFSEGAARRKLCNKCGPHRRLPDHLLSKLEAGKHLIRNRAKKACQERPQFCIRCNYGKHVEVCHIRHITDFPDDALLSEINAPDNLVLLCPNCHWEFDHGMLSTDDLVGHPSCCPCRCHT